MKKRNIRKQFWVDENEAYIIKTKANKIGVPESVFIRDLILGYKPKEKPDKEFYNFIKQVRGIATNINQLTLVANSKGFIDVEKYNAEIKLLNQFVLDVKKKFLLSGG